MMDSFKRDGVMIAKSVFDENDISALRLAAYSHLLEGGTDYSYTSGLRIATTLEGVPSLAFWPSLGNSTFDDYRIDDEMTDIVREMLGDDVKQLNNQLYYRFPNDNDSFNWHRDEMFRKGMVEGYSADDYIQTALCIDDQTEENGGVCFIVGSHKDILLNISRDELRNKPEHREDAKYFYPKSGDLMIWHLHILHSSKPNISTHPRMVYMNGFARSRACQPDIWPDYLVNGTIQYKPINVEAIPYN